MLGYADFNGGCMAKIKIVDCGERDCELNTSNPAMFFRDGEVPSEIASILALSWEELSVFKATMPGARR